MLSWAFTILPPPPAALQLSAIPPPPPPHLQGEGEDANRVYQEKVPAKVFWNSFLTYINCCFFNPHPEAISNYVTRQLRSHMTPRQPIGKREASSLCTGCSWRVGKSGRQGGRWLIRCGIQKTPLKTCGSTHFLI